MKNVYITGVSGFVGSFLAEHLLSLSEYKIFGTYHSDNGLASLSHIKDSLTLAKVDLLDAEAVEKQMNEVKPDVVFHLAASASPAESFHHPTLTLTNNITGQVNLFEAIKNAHLSPRIIVISSGDVYGLITPDDNPINEDTPMRPASPYAVSKITQDFLAYQYFLSQKFDIVRVRPFNHIGPRQSPKFVVPAFAKQIAEIEKQKKSPSLRVGNLTAKKDFTDVRDIVQAYTLLMEKGKSGEVYNVGSGDSYQIEEVLKKLLGFSHVEITVDTDEALFRPVETPEVVCDHTKVTSETGWTPKIPLEKTLKDTLEYWRQVV